MKKGLLCMLTALSFNVFAEGGPTSAGDFSIGMSREKFILVDRIILVSCETGSDFSIEITRFCADGFSNTVGSSKYSLNGVEWEVMRLNYQIPSVKPLISWIGPIYALFYKDRLIRLKIKGPSIDIETLISKYGKPKESINIEKKECQNKGGARFENEVGNLDFIWTNGAVRAVLRVKSNEPQKTCTDGDKEVFYILEEPSTVKIIEDAIASNEREKKQEQIRKSAF
jgi:hypothetical protein